MLTNDCELAQVGGGGEEGGGEQKKQEYLKKKTRNVIRCVLLTSKILQVP